MARNMAVNITRKAATPITSLALTSVNAKANLQVLTHLVDGREETESVLTINPV